jgi:hypothetical protein
MNNHQLHRLKTRLTGRQTELTEQAEQFREAINRQGVNVDLLRADLAAIQTELAAATKAIESANRRLLEAEQGRRRSDSGTS